MRRRLQNYELAFDFVYRASIKNRGADELSRLHLAGEETTDIIDDLPIWNVRNTQVKNTEIAVVHVCTK